MSDEPTKRGDEQLELLKEIRDILAVQTKEASEQWAEYNERWAEHFERWDAQKQADKKAKKGCIGKLILMGLILFLCWVANLISK